MERKEAAQFLEVSLRTLDRMSACGLLKKHKAMRKSRPCITFNDEDLIRLRAELRAEPISEQLEWRLEDERGNNVGFRLDAHYLERLHVEGQERGLSRGQYARNLVIQALESESASRVEHEIRRIRESLGATFYALLTMKLGASPSEARSIVNETILKE